MLILTVFDNIIKKKFISGYIDGWTNEEKQAYQSTTINGKMSAKLYKRTVKWKKKKLKRLAKLKKKQADESIEEECTFQPKINKFYGGNNKNKNNLINDPLWNTDKNYKMAIMEHCKYLGIDTKAHPDLIYIGRDSLFAPVPEGWEMIVDDEDIKEKAVTKVK